MAFSWPLSEVKDMSIRERNYWTALKRWKDEYQQWQRMNQTSRGA